MQIYRNFEKTGISPEPFLIENLTLDEIIPTVIKFTKNIIDKTDNLEWTWIILLIIFLFILGRTACKWEEKKKFEEKIALIESKKNALLREVEDLKRLNEKYLFFVVRIPETVKHLNSNLTFDEIISSIIRFTKDIINTDCIELYLYDEKTNELELEAAYGSIKKKRINIPYGEGIIGKAAELESIITRDNPSLVVSKRFDNQIFLGAPIMFRKRLLGVLGIGKIKNLTADEKRLIAMISDLAGVSLQNCERLTTAQYEANTDGLTKLYNKKYLTERSLDEEQKAANYNYPVSIFMFDIDHFKKYNDNNGHAEGDYLLRELGRLLKENTKRTDLIARYGGEEFVVLLPNTDKTGAYLYGEKIRSLIESSPFRHREKQPLGFVSISGGVATFPRDGDTIESTIKAADTALYKSKETGRNRVAKFERF